MRNIYLRIGDDGVVKVSSSKVSQKRIDALIDEKAGWITKALQKVSQKATISIGEEILYFGEICSLEDPRFSSLKDLCATSPTEAKTKLYYQNFYKQVAHTYLQERLEHFAELMGLKPKEMRLRRMKRQWGNCRSNNIVTFNIHLIQTPKECIDYVIVHELAHMVHMNHSKAFHALVEQYLPQSKEKRAQLKRFSASL